MVGEGCCFSVCEQGERVCGDFLVSLVSWDGVESWVESVMGRVDDVDDVGDEAGSWRGCGAGRELWKLVPDAMVSATRDLELTL